MAMAISGVVLMAGNGALVADGKQREHTAANLTSFNSCKQLNGYAGRHPRALRSISGFGVGLPVEDGPTVTTPAPGAPEGGERSPIGDEGTNIQEAGVDEPDIVKAADSLIYAVAKGRLHAVDVSGPAPVLLDSIELPGQDSSFGGAAELLISGDRALLISEPGYGGGEPVPLSFAPYTPQSMLAEVDISNPAAMIVTRTLRLEGSYVSSRLAGTTARVVISSTPQYPAAPEPPNGGPGGPTESGLTMRAAVRRSGPNWMPTALLNDHTTGTRTARPITPCSSVSHPGRFSGLETLTVLTIDLERGLPAIDSDAVATSGQILYASPQSLYVATERWYNGSGGIGDRVSDVSTEIHKFDTSAADQTSYRASGEVSGYMLSQWSLSEREGILRVASTSAPPWSESGPGAKSQSFVTTLAESGGALTGVGQLGGLGSNQRIYAVRFMGDTGYVVTFRQVDPLYTIDLSDPTAPRVVGELEIPGYSAYLHPLGDGLLLGVGQAASTQGRLLGTQLSVFNVANLASPSLIEQQTIAPHAYSEVESDHHAFLYYAPSALAVIPVEYYDESSGRQIFAGAIGYRVGAGGVDEVGRVTHGGTGSDAVPVRRSLVIDSRLYTVSENGVVASDLTTLAPLAEVRFPAAP